MEEVSSERKDSSQCTIWEAGAGLMDETPSEKNFVAKLAKEKSGGISRGNNRQ